MHVKLNEESAESGGQEVRRQATWQRSQPRSAGWLSQERERQRNSTAARFGPSVPQAVAENKAESNATHCTRRSVLLRERLAGGEQQFSAVAVASLPVPPAPVWFQIHCALTLRSSRPAPARHPGRPEPSTMLLRSARAPCLHGRLSSNVRPHNQAHVPVPRCHAHPNARLRAEARTTHPR